MNLKMLFAFELRIARYLSNAMQNVLKKPLGNSFLLFLFLFQI